MGQWACALCSHACSAFSRSAYYIISSFKLLTLQPFLCLHSAAPFAPCLYRSGWLLLAGASFSTAGCA